VAEMSNLVYVIAAIITALGALGAALIANWEKFFGKGKSKPNSPDPDLVDHEFMARGTPQAVTIRFAHDKLSSPIIRAILLGDPAPAKAARKTLAKILTAAKIQFDSSASASSLLEVLKQAMIAAADDDAKLKTLSEAVKSVASQ
jgi:hypothetical protein